MRITGTLHSVGTIHECGDQIVHGILIVADDETLRAASNLLYATVDIYPYPVNGLVASECTPENYAHALARLAHTEDHLAREVRSSQALAAKQKEQERQLSIYRTKYHETDTAWLELSKKCEKRPPGLGGAHARIAELEAEVQCLQEEVEALEAAQARIAELTQLLAIAERSAAKYEQKYLDASQALGEARAVIDSLNAASFRGDSELSDNEDEGRR